MTNHPNRRKFHTHCSAGRSYVGSKEGENFISIGHSTPPMDEDTVRKLPSDHRVVIYPHGEAYMCMVSGTQYGGWSIYDIHYDLALDLVKSGASIPPIGHPNRTTKIELLLK